jgi:hypothetical protein
MAMSIIVVVAGVFFASLVVILLVAVLILLVTKETVGLRDLGGLIESIGLAIRSARSSSADPQRGSTSSPGSNESSLDCASQATNSTE